MTYFPENAIKAKKVITERLLRALFAETSSEIKDQNKVVIFEIASNLRMSPSLDSPVESLLFDND